MDVEILNLDSSSEAKDAYLLKATKFFDRFEMEEAVKCAKRHLGLFPKDPRAYYIIMEADYESGEFEEALVYCDKLLEIEKLDPKVYARKAFFLGTQREIDQAVDYYDKAIALDPSFYDAICDKGRLLSECIDCEEEALEAYKKAILIDPNKGEAYMGAASVYMLLGDKKKAVEFSSKAHEVEPEDEFYKMHSNIIRVL